MEYHKTWQSIHHLRTRHILGIGILELDGTRQGLDSRVLGFISFLGCLMQNFVFLLAHILLLLYLTFWGMLAFEDEWVFVVNCLSIYIIIT